MCNPLGYSVYLSTFPLQQALLEGAAGSGAPVFLSLHISEEFGADYAVRAERLCRWLAEREFKIIADVSVKTVEQFGEPDLVRLAKRLGIWALRIDYGFTMDEIAALARDIPVVLNASTTSPEDGARIADRGGLVMAMHNFYPRPETGLDDQFLLESTRSLQAAGLKVLAFIPGEDELRGPLHLGLPTLERHRDGSPYAAFAELTLRFGMDGVFLADPGLSPAERERIGRLARDGVLSLPALLDEEHTSLYGKEFTCRVDSPAWMVRFAESRVYSCFGSSVTPAGGTPRPRGTITVDNALYGRYSGEIQLLRDDFPGDERVNVIGHIAEQYLLLLDCIKRGGRFALTRSERT